MAQFFTRERRQGKSKSFSACLSGIQPLPSAPSKDSTLIGEIIAPAELAKIAEWHGIKLLFGANEHPEIPT
ncbi:hypothetical protein, partial [Staphylococcus nepalensis]|uniref:hypothetical protein n=1 Tax=Staphylococcus nepalensis TaxID=214473 RepID=UPI002854A05C